MNTFELMLLLAGAIAGGYAALLVVIGAGINRDCRGIEASTAQLQATTDQD